MVRILTMACGALSEAHAIGLIHRDIKPANIMLCTQGGERDVVKLLDFGLVKEFEVGRDVTLTGASMIVGTPQYMAPESILAPDSVDARTDIYALGAVAYYLLAGVDVFDGKSIVEVCGQHLHQEPDAAVGERARDLRRSSRRSCLLASTRIPIAALRAPSSSGAGSRRARLSPGTMTKRWPGGASTSRTSIASRGKVRATSGPSPSMERAGPRRH